MDGAMGSGRSPMQKIRWIGVALIVMLGGWLRMEAALQTEIIAPVRADAAQYLLYAYNLKFFGVYSKDASGLTAGEAPEPDALRSPGYPLAILPFMDRAPTTGTLLEVTVAQALLSTALLLVVYLVAQRVLPFGYALGVTTLTALSPHLINANVYLLTEGLFAFCTVALLWVLVREGNRPWLVSLLLGVVVGYGALVRPSLQYFIVPAALMMFWFYGRPWGVRAAAVAVLGFLLVYSPWIIRNEVQFGYATDQQLKAGTLHHGMYPGLRYQDRPETFGFPYRYDPESARIASGMDEVFGEIRRRFSEEPGRHLEWYLFGKPVMLWSWDIVQGQGDAFVYEAARTPYTSNPLFTATHGLMKLLHWPLVFLSAISAIAVWLAPGWFGLSRGGLLLVRMASLLVLYFTALHMVAAPFPRYTVPLRPVTYLLALLTLPPAVDFVRQRFFGGRALPQEEPGS